MASQNGYQQWLATCQCKPGFVNNYWCVVLSNVMNQRPQFNMPYFILEEELEKENDNVYKEDASKAFESVPVMHFLVHLLKVCRPDTTLYNYEPALREYLNRQYILPPGIENPLTPSSSFHCLPTECKLWIFCSLITNGRSGVLLPEDIYKDQEKNVFYLLFPSRLYVKMAQDAEKNLAFKEDDLRRFAWGSLYQHTFRDQFKLLSESKSEWDVVWKTLQRLNVPNVFNAIYQRVESEMAMSRMKMTQRENERREFSVLLASLPPKPSITKKSDTKKSPPISQSNGSTPQLAVNGTSNTRGNNPSGENRAHKEILHDKEEKDKREFPMGETDDGRINRRCSRFPQCDRRFFPNCKFKHPRTACRHFPDCPGMRCLYRHQNCINDGGCDDNRCPYEHEKSQPTLLRPRREERKQANSRVSNRDPLESQPPVTSPIVNSAPTANPRKTSTPNAGQPRGRSQTRMDTGKAPNQNQSPSNGTNNSVPPSNYNDRKTSSAFPTAQPRRRSKSRAESDRTTNNENEVQKTAKKASRCQFFPKCKFANCKYSHPVQRCKTVEAGLMCVRGRWCLNLHGPCPNDGSCQHAECIYEHYKSLPVMMRSRNGNNKNNEPSSGMRRAGSQASLGNMSTVSAATTERQSRSRRSSVSRSGHNISPSSDEESIESSATSQNNKRKIQVRCKFLPECTKGKNCDYVHPSKPCKAFPECPYGGSCIFLHEICPRDGVCVKQSCSYEHEERRDMNREWCSKGSTCKTRNCPNLHPEECTRPCPTPDNCWKYHPPQAAQLPPQPGHGPAPRGPPIMYQTGPMGPMPGPMGPMFGQMGQNQNRMGPMHAPHFEGPALYQHAIPGHAYGGYPNMYPNGMAPPPQMQWPERMGPPQTQPPPPYQAHSQEERDFVNRKIADERR